MATSTVDYLNLSALAYIDFSGHTGKTVAALIEDDVILKDKDLTKPQLSALTDPSNPLRSYTLLSQSKFATAFAMLQFSDSVHIIESNFSAIALQNPETKEIVFAFRGTNDWTDYGTDGFILAGASVNSIDQFQQAKKFVAEVLQSVSGIKRNSPYEYLAELSKGTYGTVSFTGHSLGGGLAQYLSNLFSKRSMAYA